MEDLAALGAALADGATENNSSCGADGENDACCAICLGALDSSADIALVKSCLHPFCVGCISAWASSRCVPATHSAAALRVLTGAHLSNNPQGTPIP